MKKSGESAAKVESGELELPDWSGMDDSSARISPDAAFQLCEQYPQWFGKLSDKWKSQRAEKCVVEFAL